MLTKDTRTLLENALNALDRLFDGHSTVKDVHALLESTAIALRGDSLGRLVEDAAERLEGILRSRPGREEMRELGLRATDELRRFVAETLEQDAIENPKRRHIT